MGVMTEAFRGLLRKDPRFLGWKQPPPIFLSFECVRTQAVQPDGVALSFPETNGSVEAALVCIAFRAGAEVHPFAIWGTVCSIVVCYMHADGLLLCYMFLGTSMRILLTPEVMYGFGG